jgi:hypothetical protein
VSTFTIDDLAEDWGEADTPATERFPATANQWAWQRDGVVILPGFAPEALMALYETEWLAVNGGFGAQPGWLESYASPGGWDYATPYMDYPMLKALCCEAGLATVLAELIGEPAGVHLNLTGWRSTRRDWHFDQYLNPPGVGAHYAAVWLALDDIHPDSGPFQYVPGSHHWWPPISQDLMRQALGLEGATPQWPAASERILTPLFEAELEARHVTPTSYRPVRGDVLIWHSRLLHRGSVPRDETMERRALISHFSGIHHRPDMPPARHHPLGGWWFPLDGRQPVR